MLTIRSGRGLGDSLYLRPIVEHFVGAGESVVALSDYPTVFDGSGARVERFTRERDRRGVRVAHYTHTMATARTQFAEMLAMAKIGVAVPLRFTWNIQNDALVERLTKQAAGRPLILVHGGRTPMQRTDGFAADLIPRREAFAAALAALDDCYRVRIGKAPHTYALAVDVDLNGSTSVADLLDLASACAGVVAQCSFAVPLAEALGKPLLAIWAARGLVSATPYVRLIRPAKVLTAAISSYVVDDWPEQRIAEAALAFRGV